MRKISKTMEIMYITKRNTTLELIRDTIESIQSDNRIVTKKELIDTTGLSSGTFSKDYVKDLLREKGVCQFRKLNINPQKEILEESLSQKLDVVLRENKRFLSENQDLKMKVERQTKKTIKLNEDYNILKVNYEMLLGKHQQILEYLDSIGSDQFPYTKML